MWILCILVKPHHSNNCSHLFNMYTPIRAVRWVSSRVNFSARTCPCSDLSIHTPCPPPPPSAAPHPMLTASHLPLSVAPLYPWTLKELSFPVQYASHIFVKGSFMFGRFHGREGMHPSPLTPWLNPNPNRHATASGADTTSPPLKCMLAFHFIHALAWIHCSTPVLHRTRTIRRAAYTSMARTASPCHVWSRELLQQICMWRVARSRRAVLLLWRRVISTAPPIAREESTAPAPQAAAPPDEGAGQGWRAPAAGPRGNKMEYSSLLEETADCALPPRLGAAHAGPPLLLLLLRPMIETVTTWLINSHSCTIDHVLLDKTMQCCICFGSLLVTK
jgi:hypothetical protein